MNTAGDANGSTVAGATKGVHAADGQRATWHTLYLTALTRRASQQPAAVRHLLEDRLVAVRRAAPSAPIAPIAPMAAAAAVADAAPPRFSPAPDSPLVELTRTLAQRFGQDARTDPLAPPAELQALRQFRATWTQLSVDRQVAQAMAAAPENAGPLNSHFLALRTLGALRELSPEYLNRFVSYLDALLCLDHAAKKGKPAAKKLPRTKAGKRIG